MSQFKQIICSQGKLIIKAILVSFVLFFICRIIFHIHNFSSFKSLGFINTTQLYWFGFLFDASAIALVNILFILLFILPVANQFQNIKNKIAGVFFIVFNAIAIAINIFDTAYFPFTNKRITVDMIGFGGDNGNLIQLIPRFIIDYWILIIALIVLIILLIKFVKNNIFSIKHQLNTANWFSKIAAFFLNFIVFTTLLLLMFRGWFVTIPLGIVDANKYTQVQNTPLIVNSVFTIAKSIGTDVITPFSFYKEDELEKIYNPITPSSTNKNFTKKNVVIIMVESLSKEFVGSLSGLPSHTPFLDSLSKHSLVFTDAYSNGKQSVQGIPAITSSLPSIMNGYFINTPYSNNNFKGLGTLLQQQGYYTAFFHGAHNGSMNFDAFAKQAGYKDYFGRNEYNNEQDFDGDWGIWDEEFLQFAANKMNDCKKPFHFSIFTLSSHNPYSIPKKYQQKFKIKYSNPLMSVVEYTDFSLQLFFNKIKKEPWYNNTLFVITADHTGESLHSFYSNFIGQYQIPILFFDPSKNVQEVNNSTTSQADILPNILHQINYPAPNFNFGNDVFTKPSFGIFYTNQQYQITKNGYVLSFNGKQSTALYCYKNDSLLRKNILLNPSVDSVKQYLEKNIKAYIQQYNNRIINNKMMVE
jgi:phosphoglycerol transferase MdoB-like AlkP superfamily enzyme